MSVAGDFQRDQRPAIPIGLPSLRPIRVQMFLPVRQSGSQIAHAGLMQWLPHFQASRNGLALATVSLLALWEYLTFSSLAVVRDQAEAAGHRFAFRDRIVAAVAFARAPDEGRVVALEHVFLQIER